MSNEVEVQGGRVKIQGKEFSLQPYIIEGTIGAGANGVVLKADNPLLGRKEAIKIWLALRARDRRDKIEQGILEAQKQVAEQSSVVVKIYHANIQDGLFYATMEFFDGIDLKKFLKSSSSLYRRLIVAGRYLQAINITSKPSRFHGDPHLGNVLLGSLDPQASERPSPRGQLYILQTMTKYSRLIFVGDQLCPLCLNHTSITKMQLSSI